MVLFSENGFVWPNVIIFCMLIIIHKHHKTDTVYPISILSIWPELCLKNCFPKQSVSYIIFILSIFRQKANLRFVPDLFQSVNGILVLKSDCDNLAVRDGYFTANASILDLWTKLA